MSYVIYHISSTMQVGPTPNGHPHSGYAKPYKTLGAALRTMAKFNDKYRYEEFVGPGPYGACSREHYETRVVRQVTRTNLLSGKQYQEASNTPGYCSPSSESYWSM